MRKDSHADRLSNTSGEGQTNERKEWMNERDDRAKGDQVRGGKKVTSHKGPRICHT